LDGTAEVDGCLLPDAFADVIWWEGPAPARVVLDFLPIPFGKGGASGASIPIDIEARDPSAVADDIVAV
jgi:hypothetical protein